MYDSSLLQKVHDVCQLVGVLQHFIWSESLLEGGVECRKRRENKEREMLRKKVEERVCRRVGRGGGKRRREEERRRRGKGRGERRGGSDQRRIRRLGVEGVWCTQEIMMSVTTSCYILRQLRNTV